MGEKKDKFEISLFRGLGGDTADLHFIAYSNECRLLFFEKYANQILKV